MLATNPTTKKSLAGVVNRLTGDRCLREDLMQEAMVHFWKVERERPGQTLSWYLQSCTFHLRHYLASGRSIDSSKRRSLQIELPEDEEMLNGLGWAPTENSVPAQVSARECMHLLPRYLTPRERAILRCLAEGFRPREIARHLLLSHPTVNKCRRRIAALATRLGFDLGWGERVRPGEVSRSEDIPAAVCRQPDPVLETSKTPCDRLPDSRAEIGRFQRREAEKPEISRATIKESERNGVERTDRLLRGMELSLSATE